MYIPDVSAASILSTEELGFSFKINLDLLVQATRNLACRVGIRQHKTGFKIGMLCIHTMYRSSISVSMNF